MAFLFALVLLSPMLCDAQEPVELKASCKKPNSSAALRRGFELQQDGNAVEASKAYLNCLKEEPECVACLYEIGWSYWKQGEWQQVIRTWEQVLKVDPKHAEAAQYLPSAKETLAALEKKNFNQSLRTATELMTESTPVDGPLVLTFIARWQSYNNKPAVPLDHYDTDIFSPKSITFSTKGDLVFLNSLEAGKTIVYDALGIEKKAVIDHRFGPEDSKLFDRRRPFSYRFPKAPKNHDVFTGKPVESALSHGGRYLWTSYYRRSFDPYGNHPSALAVIDTTDFRIRRVFGTGPIAKYVKVSPDGKWLAVSHWGDNTVGLFDISSDSPAGFKEAALLVVEKRLETGSLKGDRDRNCGFCVRGLEFSKDSRYLFVGRMRKGGIAAFDLKRLSQPYLGTVFGINPGPRDLHTDRSGEWLYSSCNASGFISKIPAKMIIDKLTGARAPHDGKITIRPKDEGITSLYAGLGIRSFKLSPEDRYLFAAANQTSEVLAIRTQDMKIVARIPVDSYPVGLDISPDGSRLWVTSQGRGARGGNSVSVFQIRYKNEETILKSSYPAGSRQIKTGPDTSPGRSP
jgi:WD40 repeat protein